MLISSFAEPLFKDAPQGLLSNVISPPAGTPSNVTSMPQPGTKTRLNEGLDTFILLSRPPSTPQPTGLEKNSLSHRLKIANKLFEYASGVSLVQHPLCQDCTDDLTVKLEKRLGALKKERDAYAAYIESSQGVDATQEQSTGTIQENKEGSEQDLQKLK